MELFSPPSLQSGNPQFTSCSVRSYVPFFVNVVTAFPGSRRCYRKVVFDGVAGHRTARALAAVGAVFGVTAAAAAVAVSRRRPLSELLHHFFLSLRLADVPVRRVVFSRRAGIRSVTMTGPGVGHSAAGTSQT
jgi:hypothetical protein